MAGRPSLDREEYEQLAKDKNLIFTSKIVPGSVRFKTSWHCPVCDTDLFTSYHKLKYKGTGCRCSNGMNNSFEKYLKLADFLGIHLVSTKKPRNVFQKLEWKNGETIFTASYHELAYASIPKRLRQYVGAYNGKLV